MGKMKELMMEQQQFHQRNPDDTDWEYNVVTNAPAFSINGTDVLGKAAITELANNSVENILENLSPATSLTAKAMCKAAIDYFTKVDKGLTEVATNEATKHGRIADHNFGKTEVRNSGDRFNYDEDSNYANLKARIKAREELLKTAGTLNTIIYDEDGVLVPIVSKTYGSDTLYITLKS